MSHKKHMTLREAGINKSIKTPLGYEAAWVDYDYEYAYDFHYDYD